MTRNGPDFVIIGAMKCATSTLSAQLGAQSGIFMTELKEPCYFSDDDVYSRGAEWYQGLFSAALPRDLCGEASTHYTKLPHYPATVDRIRSAFPDLRLIYMMRHPIDRIISQYIHEWSMKRISVPIDDAIARHPELIAYSQYARQLKPWFRAYGMASVLPVFVEHLHANPSRELERVARFIGMSAPVKWQEQSSRNNQSNERLRKSKWRDLIVNAPVLAELRRTVVPKSIRERVKNLWRLKERPVLSDGVRAGLVSILDEDLEELGRLLGKDLRCNTFGETVKTEPLEWASHPSFSCST